MLPTLAERLREQRAKGRSRHPSRAPWPMPSEPPTALLFQVQPGLAVTEPPALPEPEPVLAAPSAAPAAGPAPAGAQDPVPAPRTAVAEVLVLLVLAVVVLIDGALALASLVDQLSRRQRVPPVSPSPAVPAAALAARSGPWALVGHP